jgi:hypothetical protein
MWSKSTIFFLRAHTWCHVAINAARCAYDLCEASQRFFFFGPTLDVMSLLMRLCVLMTYMKQVTDFFLRAHTWSHVGIDAALCATDLCEASHRFFSSSLDPHKEWCTYMKKYRWKWMVEKFGTRHVNIFCMGSSIFKMSISDNFKFFKTLSRLTDAKKTVFNFLGPTFFFYMGSSSLWERNFSFIVGVRQH